MSTFLEVCRIINFPVNLEKTFLPATCMTFLGFLIDTIRQIMCIPMEKIAKGKNMISYVLNHKKITVLELQQLCGFLNFLSRCILPGRAFSKRLYAHQKPGMKQHHHLRVTPEMRMDLNIWDKFLKHQSIYCRPFMDYTLVKAQDIDFYTDASKNPFLGFCGRFGEQFMMQQWNTDFIIKYDPSITYLELYTVTAAVLAWGDRLANRRVSIFCDNTNSCGMINFMTANCRNCMVLVRILVL